MLWYPANENPRPLRDGTARPVDRATPNGRCGPPPHTRPAIDCEFRDGLATVRGKGLAHYTTGQNGRHMLIVDRRPGERIRINSTTEVVILEIGPGDTRVAIEIAEMET
jgi:hypothetical protein